MIDTPLCCPRGSVDGDLFCVGWWEQRRRVGWTNAKTTLAGAIALASANGDVIKVAHTHTGDNALAVDTTWTALNNISIVSVDKTNSDAPTAMGTAAWLGSSSAAVALTVAGGYRVLLSGLTFRNAGSVNKSPRLRDFGR